MTETIDGRSVHERMSAILAELPPIGKDDYNQQQKFHFRGHDAVMNALNPLLAKHGVFVVPEVLDRVTAQRTTSKGSVMYEVSLHVGYRFYGPAGDSVFASSWGEGTDMGDKATSKAMTMAFKSVLNQTFAISNAEFSDPDGTVAEETVAAPANPATVVPPDLATKEQVAAALKHIDPTVDWRTTWRNACTKFYGTVELDEQQTFESWARLANVAVKLMEGGDFPPPVATEIQAAFAGMFGGVMVEVEWLEPEEPEPAPMTAEEVEAAKAAMRGLADEDIPFGEEKA